MITTPSIFRSCLPASVVTGARRLRHALLALAALSLSAGAFAESFEVQNMRVEGLQRISEGTVFNYLPINIGDVIDEVRVREALRALYGEGLFDDVALRREGNTLVIVVKERPSIESFAIDGNKDIKTEDLMDSLRGVGLSRGKTFDRSVLDEVTQFLIEQYYSRGKYGVSVDTRVEERPNNAVAIFIDVKEGERAKIRQINVVGNRVFDDETLTSEFSLKTPNWLSFIRQDDRYSKEALTGDLETISSFYLDRGYADFQVTSTQVARTCSSRSTCRRAMSTRCRTSRSPARWSCPRRSCCRWCWPSRATSSTSAR